MIIDNFLVMSDAQEVLTTAASESYIDTLAAGNALVPGARLKVIVNTAFTTSDSATLTVALQTDSDSGFATALATLLTTSALAVTSIDAIGDNILDIQIPVGMLRYLRMYYTVGTGSFLTGKVDARIVLDTARTMDKTL